MKKLLIIFAALSMLLMCMTACSGSEDPEPTPDPKPNPAPGGSDSSDSSDSSDTESVYDLLDELANEDYSRVDIDVEVETGFAKLYSNYTLTRSSVIYNIEKLNLLPPDGNIANLPENAKTTVSGYALIENGRVVELDGDSDIELPSYSELRGNFSFDEHNFTNAYTGDGYFEADVISPTSFYGTYVDMSDLKVEVEYTNSALMEIVITYRTQNATVRTVYSFIT